MALGNMAAAQRAAAAAAEREAQRQASYDNAWRHEMSMWDGEVLIGRFVQHPDSPFVWPVHSTSRIGFNAPKLNCLDPLRQGKPCPACSAAETEAYGQKRVKRASDHLAFYFISTRETFMLTKPGKNPIALPIRKNGDGAVLARSNGVVSVLPGGEPSAQGQTLGCEGLKIWRGSSHPMGNNGARVLDLDRRLSKLCLCGAKVGEGYNAGFAEVTTKGWSCSECGTNVGWDPMIGSPCRCPACSSVMTPDEVMECSAGCDSPARQSITDGYVRVTRKGSGLNTEYIFEPLPKAELAAEHVPMLQGINDLKLSEVYAPNSVLMVRELQNRGLSAQAPGQAPGQGAAPGGGGGNPWVAPGGDNGGTPGNAGGVPW